MAYTSESHFRSQSIPISASAITDDDDFQDPSPSQPCLQKPTSKIASCKPLVPYSSTSRSSKKTKPNLVCRGKEKFVSVSPLGKIVVGKCAEDLDLDLESGHGFDSSRPTKKPKPVSVEKSSVSVVSVLEKVVVGEFDEYRETPFPIHRKLDSDFEDLDLRHGLDNIESTIDGCYGVQKSTVEDEELKRGYFCNSIEARLLKSNGGLEENEEDLEECSELDVLLKLCGEEDEGDSDSSTADLHCQEECSGLEDGNDLIYCPLCGSDISDLSCEMRQVHTNECLDKECPGQVLNTSPCQSPKELVGVAHVVEWLQNLGLAKYGEVFVREEIDWDTLKSLTEEDLFSIGVTALGPRKKIANSILELRKESAEEKMAQRDVTKVVPADDAGKTKSSKLITDYFICSDTGRKKVCAISRAQTEVGRARSDASRKIAQKKNPAKNAKFKDVPVWCSIPGTPFRVDAFKYLRRDCSHWFLTHFHLDHYQGLTRSFCHGKIFCSSITAKLVNMKIGIPWDKIEILPLNQKINIAGIDVTCFDANHCPGSLVILFEPPNGKAVLHTGDFRFCEQMSRISILQTCRVRTLILDTTYCDPQYDFPKQEAVIQFVIESIQAETFNPKTLFLIGSYTIGKERLFVEVARALQKKVYITAPKLRILECLGFPQEDLQLFTLNEQESQIHVVPMWTLASFKRLKYVSNQYADRYSLIVAFSPSGWSFGKGKKKSTGRRWQQGTIIRYEVPYSEHCSFSELKEFVKFVSPVNIIPSVNNHGPESTNTLLSHLLD